MTPRVAVIVGVFIILFPCLAPAQDMKLPVFFLRYDGGVGSEEIEPEDIEEEQLEPSSQRHKVTLRIKEEWSDSLTTNLYTAVARKEYFLQAGSYTYFYLNPDFAWDITDRLQWSTGFRSKWIVYDELDARRAAQRPHQPSGQNRAHPPAAQGIEADPLLARRV